MRMIATVLAMLSAAAATAQTPPLAAGEVLLQIAATGKVRNRPDSIIILVPIGTTGATAVAARAANQAKIDRLKAALAAKGVGPAMIAMRPPPAQFGFIGNEAYGDGEGSPLPAALAAMGRKSAQAQLEVTVPDQAGADRVREVLDTEDQAMFGTPIARLRDDGPARAAASAEAVAQARRDAAAYAAPLGLRVVRIARVANYGDSRQMDWQAATAFTQQFMLGNGSDRDVVTQANVWVDFVLAPEK